MRALWRFFFSRGAQPVTVEPDASALQIMALDALEAELKNLSSAAAMGPHFSKQQLISHQLPRTHHLSPGTLSKQLNITAHQLPSTHHLGRGTLSKKQNITGRHLPGTLHRLGPGSCGTTVPGTGCVPAASSGEWTVPTGIHPTAIHGWCYDRCRTCEACRFFSVAGRHRRCAWFAESRVWRQEIPERR
jgi:hypothetical protein